MKTNKNLKLILLLALGAGFSAAFGMNNNQVTEVNTFNVTTKEAIIKQNVNFEFYDNQNDKTAIANLWYYLLDESTICLSYLKIYNRSNRGNSLGKEIMNYFINDVKKRNPAIKIIRGRAITLDERYMSQENLEKWYTAFGGVKTGPCLDGGSYFELKVSNFNTEQNLGSCLQLDGEESSEIKSYNTIKITNNQADTVAQMGYVLDFNKDKKSLRYDIKIKNMIIELNHKDKTGLLAKLLKQEILKNIVTKKWLPTTCQFNTCSYFTKSML